MTLIQIIVVTTTIIILTQKVTGVMATRCNPQNYVVVASISPVKNDNKIKQSEEYFYH